MTDENGKELALETEAGGTEFKLLLEKPQTVIVRETAAPDGYEALNKPYKIRIPARGDAELLDGDHMFCQDEENSYVFIAANQKKEKMKGKITVSYDETLYGNGVLSIRGQGPEILPAKTGDDFPVKLLEALFAGSAAGLLILCSRRKRRKDS